MRNVEMPETVYTYEFIYTFTVHLTVP